MVVQGMQNGVGTIRGDLRIGRKSVAVNINGVYLLLMIVLAQCLHLFGAQWASAVVENSQFSHINSSLHWGCLMVSRCFYVSMLLWVHCAAGSAAS